MKDVASTTTFALNVCHMSNRVSPIGIRKGHKLHNNKRHAVHKAPLCAKLALIQQRQRESHVMALRHQGISLADEYHEEIRFYMHEMERFTMSSTQSMDQQPEIQWHMRPCLVDFLVEIHFTFRLRPETLYLTQNIVDRYVSRRIVFVKHYQLVGCAALWIAAKFEDAKERVPTVQELAHICQETYEESAFVQMECHVLSTIQWTLGHPTAECWLRIMCYDPCVEEDKVQHVARFLMEITLFYREFINYAPSSIALGALTLSRFLCGKARRIFEETEQCMDIACCLDRRLATSADDLSGILIKKYSYAFYSKAAIFVVQYYLGGGRFIRPSLSTLTLGTMKFTTHGQLSAAVSLTSSAVSDCQSIMLPSHFSSNNSSANKENFEAYLEVEKHTIEVVSENHLPQDLPILNRAVHRI